jgi:hypothetical protein
MTQSRKQSIVQLGSENTDLPQLDQKFGSPGRQHQRGASSTARCWIGDLASGRVRSFGEIAQRQAKVERHIRLLTPLAFTPPQTLAAIVAGGGASDLTVTALSHGIHGHGRRK